MYVRLALALALLAMPAAMAQSGLFAVELRAEPSELFVPSQGGSGEAALTITVVDRSSDIPTSLVPGAPTSPVPIHTIRVAAEPVEAKVGWIVDAPTPSTFATSPGDMRSASMAVRRDPLADDPFFFVNITAVLTAEDGSRTTANLIVPAVTEGIPVFTVQGVGSATLGARGIYVGEFEIRNRHLEPRTFEVQVLSNPCGFSVGLPGSIVVDGRNGPGGGVATDSATFQAPASGFYPFGEQCQIMLGVADRENPSNVGRAFYTLTLQGVFVDYPVIQNTVLVLLLLVLLLLLARKAKQRLDVRLLAKPQKPWLIPVEAVYLRALRKRDPRAYQMVRHHLMEEEYRSALLWYEGYRKATKGTRAKERLILREETRYEKWRAKWEKRIARPVKKADRFEAKLQRKLDRKARAMHRKQRRAWKKTVAKGKKKHTKAVDAARAKWQKAATKARRRGRPEPEPPTESAFSAPREPQLGALLLADHRWSKKAARRRKRMAKKQGNLEVRFEKKDARMLASVRRKVQKKAKKLDDPDFVSEHPMLGS